MSRQSVPFCPSSTKKKKNNFLCQQAGSLRAGMFRSRSRCAASVGSSSSPLTPAAIKICGRLIAKLSNCEAAGARLRGWGGARQRFGKRDIRNRAPGLPGAQHMVPVWPLALCVTHSQLWSLNPPAVSEHPQRLLAAPLSSPSPTARYREAPIQTPQSATVPRAKHVTRTSGQRTR